MVLLASSKTLPCAFGVPCSVFGELWYNQSWVWELLNLPLVLDPQQKRKGVEGLIDIENPNRVIQTTKKVTQLDLDGPKELSRRERWVECQPCCWEVFPLLCASVSGRLLRVYCCLKQELSSSKLGSLCFKMRFLRNFIGVVCPLGAAVAILEPGSLPWCSERKECMPFLSQGFMPKIRPNWNPEITLLWKGVRPLLSWSFMPKIRTEIH